MEAGTATTIEELSSRLGDLDVRQRAAGGWRMRREGCPAPSMSLRATERRD